MNTFLQDHFGSSVDFFIIKIGDCCIYCCRVMYMKADNRAVQERIGCCGKVVNGPVTFFLQINRVKIPVSKLNWFFIGWALTLIPSRHLLFNQFAGRRS
jgi:hypothetical protein